MKKISAFITFTLTVFMIVFLALNCLNGFALENSAMNTGDTSGTLMIIMGVLMAVAFIAIVCMFVKK